MAEVDYRGTTHEDLRRLIRSEVAKACLRYGVDVRQHGDDIEQECWIIVFRKLPQYEDRGYKVTTWLFHYIRRDARAYALKIAKTGGHYVPTEVEAIEERAGELLSTEDGLPVDWESLPDAELDLLLLHAAGYRDEEIEGMTGATNIARRRSRSRKELAAG